MGKINNIHLKNFRNFQDFKISFNSNCNILFGKNGSGKTNLLESISNLGKGRGFRNSSISNLIYKNKSNFLIDANFEKNKNIYEIKVYSEIANNKYKKITSVNDEISKESNEFINSSISFLYFLPEMERLFLASPNYRRNFLDKIIFSENKNYNTLINKYKKNILERNKLLNFSEIDIDWIYNIEKEIVKNALEIFYLRNNQIKILNKNIEILNSLNKYPFTVELKINDNFFHSNLNENEYLENLKKFRDYDKKYGGSKIGPHKSDMVATINSEFDSSQLSTGQQKTLVLMILFAQCNHIINNKHFKPILLFDEICSHLDELNRNILLDLTNKFNVQIFLTGTDKSLFSFMSTNVEFYNINEL